MRRCLGALFWSPRPPRTDRKLLTKPPLPLKHMTSPSNLGTYTFKVRDECSFHRDKYLIIC